MIPKFPKSPPRGKLRSKQCIRLAARLERYAQDHSLSETAAHFNITDPSGKPSRSLVSLILGGEYEPRGEGVRIRCHLSPKYRPPRGITLNELLALPIQEMPPEVLRWAFINRSICDEKTL